MTSPTLSRIASRDQWVAHPRGRICARRWCPPETPLQASPIVMLHDSLGCVELWRDFPAALSQATGREVIAYDRLGFGQSDPRTERPAMDFVSEEALLYFPAVCEQLGVRKFVALGHSVGGGMAIQCAAEFAAAGAIHCEALVTLAAQVFPEDRTLEGIRAAREQFRDSRQIERLAKYHGDKTQWVLDAWIENWLHPGFSSWSLADVLPRVCCPTLAIHGERDEYGSTRHPGMIGQIGGGPTRVEILPGVGHVPHREQPTEILRMLAEFLANPAQAGSMD